MHSLPELQFVMFENVSSLNIISFVGLISMLGVAWLMSSHKTKVNWQLVLVGLGIQLALAAVLFQSQNWSTSTRYDNFETLQADVAAGKITLPQVDRALQNHADQFDFSDLKTANFRSVAESIVREDLNVDDFDQAISMMEGLPVPKYPNGILFYGTEQFFMAIDRFVKEGTGMVFSGNQNIMATFAFGVLPNVIFFAALMAILYHIGFMQLLIKGMAWFMQKTLGTSGAESMAAAANVMVGHTEAPLVIKPFVGSMTRSELNALMVGGFATISGSLMAIFVGMGVSAGHILTASIISAPAALVIAKILQPETETPETLGNLESEIERPATNVIEAAAMGASEGMKLAINIAAMLIAFLDLIALINWILMGCGEIVQTVFNSLGMTNQPIDLQWSLQNLFGLLFYPLAFLMGIETKDCTIAGELLGTKMVVNEFVAYDSMGVVLRGERVIFDAAGNPILDANGNPTVVTMNERTRVILTYALAGFSNFGAIGIQIGGIGPLAPHRRSDLAQLGLRAMFGGMLACCMTACVAGIMYGILR